MRSAVKCALTCARQRIASSPAVQPDRTLAVFDRDRIVGGTASEVREISLPGGIVLKAAKITLTGLLPGYRSRRRRRIPAADSAAPFTRSGSGCPRSSRADPL